MAENLLEYAQKMAEAARAGLAIERKRLKENPRRTAAETARAT